MFKEHWDIARRKTPPIYGFLCTLDIMGYASNQYFTIPYLVLLKAIEKANETKTQIFTKIKELVLETCKEIMRYNEEFRTRTVNMLVSFYHSPILRTADEVPSIRVMLAQLYTLLQLDDYQSYLPEGFSLNQETLQVIFRYAMEEQMRRSLPHTSEPLTKSQLLKLLFPSHLVEVTKIMEVRAKEVEEEFKAQSETDDAMDRF